MKNEKKKKKQASESYQIYFKVSKTEMKWIFGWQYFFSCKLKRKFDLQIFVWLSIQANP